MTHLAHFMLLLLIFFLSLSTTFQTSNARMVKKKPTSAAHARGHHYKGAAQPPARAPLPKQGGSSAAFSVMDFGARGDGKTDDTKAFQSTWAAACKVEASTMIVPSGYTFLVGPISFSGPYCAQNIVFQLDGTVIAPASFQPWGSGLFQWMLFSKLVGITIQGKGTLDGSGSIWWQDSQDDEPIEDNESRFIVPLNNSVEKHDPMPADRKFKGKMPGIKPTALRFYGSFKVTVTGIKIQNSPQCHLKFDNCVGVMVFQIGVLSPGNSPNTDGIHLQNSQQVNIRDTDIACGDDCVSIQTGCSSVFVHDVNCGPGHGISIGGLGKYNTKACVSNVTIRDIKMHNTMTGARIKTWQVWIIYLQCNTIESTGWIFPGYHFIKTGGFYTMNQILTMMPPKRFIVILHDPNVIMQGGSGSVQGVMFSNIQVSEVQLPIVIDQFYCDKMRCTNQSSAVALNGITFQRIIGTYTVKPVHLACSDSIACTGVTLNTVQLKPLQERYHMYDPFCWQAFGEVTTPTIPPIECLQFGRPAKNPVHSDDNSCSA